MLLSPTAQQFVQLERAVGTNADKENDRIASLVGTSGSEVGMLASEGYASEVISQRAGQNSPSIECHCFEQTCCTP
jgi:hypothetical protein